VTGSDVLAPYRVGPPWLAAAPELPLLCGICNRRLCEITFMHGTMRLIRVSMTVGIPRRVKAGRKARLTGGRLGEKPRDPDPRVQVYIGEADDRWRICHEHKRGGRGHLDRTVTSATLEKLYAAALATDNREVVLR
jgi:hypothetical protein